MAGRINYEPRFRNGTIERLVITAEYWHPRVRRAPRPSGPNGKLSSIAATARRVVHKWCVFNRRYFRGGSRLVLVAGPYDCEVEAGCEAAFWIRTHADERFEVMLS